MNDAGVSSCVLTHAYVVGAHERRIPSTTRACSACSGAVSRTVVAAATVVVRKAESAQFADCLSRRMFCLMYTGVRGTNATGYMSGVRKASSWRMLRSTCYHSDLSRIKKARISAFSGSLTATPKIHSGL